MSRSIRVLVVDDDFMVARIHARFVERTEGFEVAGVVHTGAAALEQVAELAPDLLLLDVHLPDLGGLEVLARLRASDGPGAGAAVVMVTAERGADAVRAARHGGALQYLVKPFEYDDLAARLREVARAVGLLDAGEADQHTIDRAFGRTPSSGAPTTAVPKGLSPETADLVLAVVTERGEVSASEAGEVVGLARVTARRYLEHFVALGQLGVRLQYGSAGRPERRYRVRQP